MNHPAYEEWMAYLYGETPPSVRQQYTQHLNECRDCSAKVELWRQTMTALDTWEARTVARPALTAAPYVRWALAAMLMIGLGVGLARITAPPQPNLRELQAQLAPALRLQFDADLRNALATQHASITNELHLAFRQDLAQMASETYAASRAETTRQLVEAGNALAITRAQDLRNAQSAYDEFRDRVETLAVLAQVGFDRTRNQITQLAGNTPLTK